MNPSPDQPSSAAVRALWQDLGLPGLIDVHTHFMPAQVMDKVWAYFDAAGPLIGRSWPITYRHAEDERVALLRGFGVRAFTSLNYPHKPAMAAWLNSWSLDFAGRVADCVPSATFFPEPEAPAYVAEVIERGARIFKVHVQVGAFDPGDPLLRPVWGMVEDAQLPVVIHAGSGPAPGRFTGPGPIADLLRHFPRLGLVIAHLGLPEYAEFLDLASRYQQVRLDTTMVFTDFMQRMHPFPAELRPRLLELGDRILFGSDFPNIPYPYLDALTALTGLDLGEAWLRGVLHDNAARLLGR